MKGAQGMKAKACKTFAGGGAVESSSKANSSWGSPNKVERMNKNVSGMKRGGKVKSK